MAAPFYTTFYCILINAHGKVLHKPFQLAVPSDADCNRIFTFLKLSVPMLRSIDNDLFSFHEPLVPISSQSLVNTLTPEQVNLGAPGMGQWTSPMTILEHEAHKWNGTPDVEAIISISILGPGQSTFCFPPDRFSDTFLQ
jgi:hypothetical protein